MDEHFAHIGIREVWGGERAAGLSLSDQRQHLYIIGKTGSGKTTLLRNLIVQHLVAGHGIGLIDPHGDLAEELLDCIPSHRADDLVYFNPGDLDFPIGFNLFANVSQNDRHLVASGIVGAFKSIWRDSWGPRLEYILYNAIAALLDCPNTSLLGVNRMLTDAEYRRRIVAKVRDPFVRAFWTDEYEQYDPRFQREAIAPIQNKLGQFLLNPVVRNILGQVRSKVSVPFMMNTGRIFIANLSKGKLGADKANLLGSLLTTQFQLAAMARGDQPEDERRDFFLFIDEFHNFTTDAFAAILSEARKYRLSLILSHQYMEQLPPTVNRHRFLRSPQIADLVGGSRQQVLRRLQKLYHHGYLERPACQIDYYQRGGSRSIAHGLASRGAAHLRQVDDTPFSRLDWTSRNGSVKRLFLDHALMISDIMVSLELACRQRCDVRLLIENEIPLPIATRNQRAPFQWTVTGPGKEQFGVIPDRVFVLESRDNSERILCFLEADRGTMPVERANHDASSIARKIRAYALTWKANIYRSKFGSSRVRVLAVTSSERRCESICKAASAVSGAQGIFLQSDIKSCSSPKSILDSIWWSATHQLVSILD